jgi:cytochrome c551/c552
VLLEHKAEVTDTTRNAKAPAFVFAAYNEKDDTTALKSLLKLGIDITGQTTEGDTALTWARRRAHPELIAELIDAGVPESEDTIPEIPDRDINMHTGNQQQLLVDSVTRSVALLQHSSDVFMRERKSCTACHHNDLPAIAASWARDKGLPIDHGALDRLVDSQKRKNPNMPNQAYQLADKISVSTRVAGYLLWEYAAIGVPASKRTEARVWNIAARQRADGSWQAPLTRPPMSDRGHYTTALAVNALQLYPLAGRETELQEKVELAAQWMTNNTPPSHQGRVFQLLGLGWAGRQPGELSQYVDELKRLQREDGGWAQLPTLSSDAWATGQSLIALHIAGGVPTEDPAYQRGLRFLLNTQFEDGSWFVQSRTFPFQKPFESGFPHGRNQWISAPATAWAAMALTLAIDPAEATLPSHIGQERLGATPSDELAADPYAPPSPPATSVQDLDFNRHIRPVLERSCVACHSGDLPDSGFFMTDRAALLRGGETEEAALVPGLSKQSPIYTAAAGTHGDLHMPPKSKRKKYPALTPQELANLKGWIDEGAKWPSGVTLTQSAY